jgi:hypothetical protein
LFIWYLLDITGLAMGDTIIVVSAFVDEPIDVIFLVLFGAFFFLYFKAEKIGKWALSIFLGCWAVLQYSKYFGSRESIESYNAFFASENTHRIFPPSESFLIKDTYHIVLDILLLIALLCVILFLIGSKRKAHR